MSRVRPGLPLFGCSSGCAESGYAGLMPTLCERFSRRQLLRASALAGVGATALALFGCSQEPPPSRLRRDLSKNLLCPQNRSS